MKIHTIIAATMALLSCASNLQAQSRPNILWIFSDDHAFQAIGAYESRFQSLDLTPNIDSIASQGMRFDRSYVANSICGPSRATLLTGKHSHQNGKIDNLGSSFDHHQQQFQKLLSAGGYQTAMIGKIHIDGMLQGFDHWEVLKGQGSYKDPVFLSGSGSVRSQGHSTDIITDKALQWLKEGRDPNKPFMAMVHYKAPHRNWLPAPRFKDRFKGVVFPEPDNFFDDYATRGEAAHKQKLDILTTMTSKDLKVKMMPERDATLSKLKKDPKALLSQKYQYYMNDYLGCIAGVDENIGRLLKYLKDNDLDENTVVMYSSDQGFYLGEHGWFDKRFMYEESYRTPLIAKWPGVIEPGSVNTDLVQNIDLAETFLDIGGVSIPTDMQGLSLVPVMKHETPDSWRKSLYYHYYEYPTPHNVRRHEGVSTKRYKLIRFYGIDVPNGEEWELYDFEKDPRDMNNLYDHPEMASKVAELKEELLKLRQQYNVSDGQFQQFTHEEAQMRATARKKKKKKRLK